MEKGLAPIGPDGKSMELHHIGQKDKGSLAEVTNTFHKENYGTIHINTGSSSSNIDRSQFDKFRAKYWKERAKQLKTD